MIDACKNVTLEQMKKAVSEAEGHDILSPEYYINFGFDKDFVLSMSVEHKSASAGKHAITKPDGTVGDVGGVWELDFWRQLAKIFGVTATGDSKFGRGTACRCYARDVLKAFEENLNG